MSGRTTKSRNPCFRVISVFSYRSYINVLVCCFVHVVEISGSFFLLVCQLFYLQNQIIMESIEFVLDNLLVCE